MFENLTNRLEDILSKIKKSPSLTESDVETGLKEIRKALLEADVALPTVKEFLKNLKTEAVGKEIVKSITPGQMLTKIVNDELIKILGETNNEINLKSSEPACILIVGLQGSGKTTSSAKLARYIEKEFKKKTLLVSLDVYRPAAQEQLRILALENKLNSLSVIKEQSPSDIALRALNNAKLDGSEVIIFDTAGRTQVDLEMMNEINQIKKIINPVETILVADSLTGQVAVTVAKSFDETVNLSSIILTRVDGDGRGGAALSMKHVTNKPIKFIGVGEKLDDLEIFYPNRIANRILGKGDIVSLVEKATKDISEENIKKNEDDLRSGNFTMEN